MPDVSDAGDIAFHARVAPPDARKVVGRQSKESVDPRGFEATVKLIGRPQACRSRLSLKCIEFKQ